MGIRAGHCWFKPFLARPEHASRFHDPEVSAFPQKAHQLDERTVSRKTDQLKPIAWECEGIAALNKVLDMNLRRNSAAETRQPARLAFNENWAIPNESVANVTCPMKVSTLIAENPAKLSLETRHLMEKDVGSGKLPPHNFKRFFSGHSNVLRRDHD